jgi:hypothetical protein
MRGLLIALMMEAASTSGTLVNFYQTKQQNNPEDSHLHTRHHENLKSHLAAPILTSNPLRKLINVFDVINIFVWK